MMSNQIIYKYRPRHHFNKWCQTKLLQISTKTWFQTNDNIWKLDMIQELSKIWHWHDLTDFWKPPHIWISHKWQHLKVRHDFRQMTTLKVRHDFRTVNIWHDSRTFKYLTLTWFDKIPKTTAHFNLTWFGSRTWFGIWTWFGNMTWLGNNLGTGHDLGNNPMM